MGATPRFPAPAAAASARPRPCAGQRRAKCTSRAAAPHSRPAPQMGGERGRPVGPRRGENGGRVGRAEWRQRPQGPARVGPGGAQADQRRAHAPVRASRSGASPTSRRRCARSASRQAGSDVQAAAAARRRRAQAWWASRQAKSVASPAQRGPNTAASRAPERHRGLDLLQLDKTPQFRRAIAGQFCRRHGGKALAQAPAGEQAGDRPLGGRPPPRRFNRRQGQAHTSGRQVVWARRAGRGAAASAPPRSATAASVASASAASAQAAPAARRLQQDTGQRVQRRDRRARRRRHRQPERPRRGGRDIGQRRETVGRSPGGFQQARLPGSAVHSVAAMPASAGAPTTSPRCARVAAASSTSSAS